MSIKLDNAQFRVFTQFAQNAADGSTILKADGELKKADGTTTKIAAKNGDGVWHFLRGAAHKRQNNEIRDIFKNTVLEMCGVSKLEDLPEKVRIAMKISDFNNKGRPLTARRIIFVHKAMVETLDPKGTKSLTENQAKALVNDAAKFVNESNKYLDRNYANIRSYKVEEFALSDAQCAQAAGLMMKHGKGLTITCQRILANYIVATIASNRYDAENVSAISLNMSRYLSNVCNFRPGDYRMKEFDANMTEYWKSYLEQNMSPEKSSAFGEDGVFNSMGLDASRSNYIINGEAFKLKDGSDSDDREAGVLNKFRTTIANVAHRKAISSFLCQATAAIPSNLHIRTNLPATHQYPAFSPKDVNGFGHLLSINSQTNMVGPAGLLVKKEPTYNLIVSEDGKTAKVAVSIPGEIRFHIVESDDWSEIPMGKYNLEMEFEFDLSDPDKAVLTNSHIGQTLECNITDFQG